MQINKAEYLISSPEFTKCPIPDRPEFAFIGRSNVGKSSLINMLCNNDKLAKTSASPGKTQLINHFAITGVIFQKSWVMSEIIMCTINPEVYSKMKSFVIMVLKIEAFTQLGKRNLRNEGHKTNDIYYFIPQ